MTQFNYRALQQACEGAGTQKHSAYWNVCYLVSVKNCSCEFVKESGLDAGALALMNTLLIFHYNMI